MVRSEADDSVYWLEGLPLHPLLTLSVGVEFQRILKELGMRCFQV
jgi:hypothetical protein